MVEVAERISFKDAEAAKRWCHANDVNIHKFNKKIFVYQFDLEFALGKPFVLALMKKHPDQWKTILQDILKWEALYNYFLLNLGDQAEENSLAHITPNQGQEKLLKRLLK